MQEKLFSMLKQTLLVCIYVCVYVCMSVRVYGWSIRGLHTPLPYACALCDNEKLGRPFTKTVNLLYGRENTQDLATQY